MLRAIDSQLNKYGQVDLGYGGLPDAGQLFKRPRTSGRFDGELPSRTSALDMEKLASRQQLPERCVFSVYGRETYLPGQLVFVRTDPDGRRIVSGERIISLQQVNQTLAANNTPDTTARRVMSTYSLHGAIAYGAGRSPTGVCDVTTQIYGAFIKLFNLWGAVVPGMTLWLILKRVDAIEGRPLQFIPYACYGEPPLHAKLYKENSNDKNDPGEMQMHAAIRVATVRAPAVAPDVSMLGYGRGGGKFPRGPNNDSGYMESLPMVEVVMMTMQ